MDPQLPAAAGYLVGVLEKIRNKCRLGYMVSKFVVDWITEATAIAQAINASIAATPPTPRPTGCLFLRLLPLLQLKERSCEPTHARAVPELRQEDWRPVHATDTRLPAHGYANAQRLHSRP